MKKYCFVEPDIDGVSPVLQCFTEEQILDEYWEHWSTTGIKRKEFIPLLTFEKCIEDWVVIHWAYLDPIK